MSLINFSFKGSQVQFEEVNGTIMANATLMAKAFNKLPKDWLRTNKAKEYIEAIRTKCLLPENQLVIVRNASPENGGGTWIHEKLILRFAQFLSTEFELWCDEKIAELLRTGKTELERLSPAEIILKQAQQLVEHERRLDDIDNRVKKIEAHQIVVNHTILGYANIKHTKINTETAKALGKRASFLCKEKGLETGLVPDEKWGKVRSYPKEVLEIVFNEFLNIEKNY